ncbi:transglycosylase domain-containing protein [Sphingomonas sp. SRS2]|uniref:transglycosylase domain-containing protein n=1 Tax=Sphingomonas sp. SRS2 TaxID=133190 RepID=UPI0006971FCC|nr:PBP1A family penicillin-binding protein [Sphingomonas sp. SRS2]
MDGLRIRYERLRAALRERGWPRRPSWQRVGVWSGFAMLGLIAVAILWATWVAPPWGPMQPPQKPSFIYLAADGAPIARRGAGEAAVDAAALPLHVRGAFIAIEDRRFADHLGIDPRGLTRAMWHNVRAGETVQGGSTITQQLAKTAFLSSDRKIGRKVQEAVLALWLDGWLSKDEILSRYLSTIYFGDGAYGLRAAARHYFQKTPEKLSIGEAAMLAGMVKAPSRLNPTVNLKAAQARSKLVIAAMAEEKMIDAGDVAGVRLAVPRIAPDELPGGTYFVDWVAQQAEAAAEEGGVVGADGSGTGAGGKGGQLTVATTLDRDLQKAAIKALTSVLTNYGDGVHATQAAMVAMRPDGQVVAMVGGRSYKASPYNRATQAQRQPGSAFKLLVYLTALENGETPDTTVENSPLTIDGWSPKNYGGSYGGPTTLRQAFAQSSNVAAVRIAERVGLNKVAATAKRLGITAPITAGPSMALGTSGMTLIELTSAYAAIASGRYPVKANGLAKASPANGEAMDPRVRESMLDLLWTATNQGTGRGAALGIPTFGKTGTTQNHRDALFIGFAGGLITGVWVGNDDDTPMRGVTGGSLPAAIWARFMNSARLRADDLYVPPTLIAAIEARQAAMLVAAEERELAELEAEEAADELENGSPIGRFIEGILPEFLRGDREAGPDEAAADAERAAEEDAREQRRIRLDELRRRKAEREGVFFPEEEEE